MREDLTVLIVGGGAREHALSNAYERSSHVKRIIIAPGNGLISYNRDKDVICEPCSIDDFDSILDIANRYKPQIIEVQNDNALAAGIVDYLQVMGHDAFGPNRRAACIEYDKDWARAFMKYFDIPVPKNCSFEKRWRAEAYADSCFVCHPDSPIFIKASGLCAGKGAIKATDYEEAVRAIDKMESFGEAGKKFLIEEGLIGEEFSYFALCDGKGYKLLKSAQDNKTVFDDDKGSMTGGMGANSPALVTSGIEEEIDRLMIAPAVDGLNKSERPFKGVLFLGGIKTESGLYVIEYNARWGDPETQVVLPAIKNDYAEIVEACMYGGLDKVNIDQDDKTRVCIVGAAKGYPSDDSNAVGKRIFGLEEVMAMDNVDVLGASMSVSDGKFYMGSGRNFNIVAEGDDILEAQKLAYSAMREITVEDDMLHYRKDIGKRDSLRHQ